VHTVELDRVKCRGSRYFDKFPEEKKHFPFKDVPKEELRKSKKFHAHCNNVMTALDAIVFNIADGELIVNLLEKLGRSHNRHGIKPSSFGVDFSRV
jgi:hypothetical protein